MGNDCNQCQEVQVCGRDALRKGLEGRAKLDLSHLQKDAKNNGLKANEEKSDKKVERMLSTEQKDPDQPPVRRIEVLQLKNGAIFEGQIFNNYRDGLARVSWPDGAEMTSNFKRDRIVDNITLKIPDKGTYEGPVKNGGLNGKGKIVLLDGQTYEGQLLDGKPHGRGSHRFPDGSFYEGQFMKGAKTGKGKYTFKNGSVYTGDFLQGNFHGQGCLKHQDGRQYIGSWKMGIMHGYGTFHYDQKVKYVGNFSEGERQGKGIYHFGDGRTWQGQWSRNTQNGKGKYSDGSGQIQQGLWRNGHRVDSNQRNANLSRQMIRIEEQN